VADGGDQVHARTAALEHLGVRVAVAERVAAEVPGDDAHALDCLARVEALAEGEVALRAGAAAVVVRCGDRGLCEGRCAAGAGSAQRTSTCTQMSSSIFTRKAKTCSTASQDVPRMPKRPSKARASGGSIQGMW